MTNNPTTPTVGTGLSTDAAADALSALVTDDLMIGDNTEDEAPSDQGEETSREVQSAGDDKSDETAEESDADEEASEPDEDSDADEGSETPMVTVVIDGKSTQVPLSEVTAGYQRQADYTRKSQALAEERKQFDTHRTSFETERQAVTQERAQLQAHLGQAIDFLNQVTEREPDWNALMQADPQGFVVQREQWRMLQERKAAIEAENARLQNVQLSEQTRARAAQNERNAQQLIAAVPEWKDDNARQTELQSLVKYAQDLGYTPQELQAADDPRAFLMMRKAWLYDQLQAGAKNLKPTKGKTLPAGSSQQVQTSRGRKQNDAMKRLVTGGGKVDDAAAVFAGMDL